MNSQRLVLALCLLVAACTGPGSVANSTTTPPAGPASVTTTTSLPVTTTTSQLATTITTTAVPQKPLALITPKGVPVAVAWSAADNHWVTTPCGYNTLVTGGTPVYQTAIVIDPGHGGDVDTGAVGRNGLSEKEINLEVAERVQQILLDRGHSVLLTRTADYASPLSVRANLADTVGAELMVSIHHNAPTPARSEVPGVLVFIQMGSAESRRLGGLLWEHTMAGLGTFNVSWVAADDAGVMTVLNTRGDDAYGIIRHPDTPTALVELGYISNPAEARLHESPIYVRVAAKAVADAIEDYLTTDRPGSGFVGGRVFNPNPGVGRDVCVEPELG